MLCTIYIRLRTEHPEGRQLKKPDEEQNDEGEGDDDQNDEIEDPDDPITGICSRPVTILPNRQVDLYHLKKYLRRHWECVRDPESTSMWNNSDMSWKSNEFLPREQVIRLASTSA